MIVDAAAEPDVILDAVSDVHPTAILTTHGHFDHVGAARPLADRLAIPFRLHRADAATFDLDPDESLTEGSIEVGRLTIDVIETPGHTPGSVSFAVDGALLSGDTLFPGGPGATRGPGSDFGRIMDSLDRLFTLPDSTLVMPGHGLDTTIGTEKPNASTWRARGW
jgi:glyoxylase-like metal-dependent hydrolase (beta-lactamase superfamily II)